MFDMYTSIILTTTIAIMILIALRCFHLVKIIGIQKKQLSDSAAELAAATQRIEDLKLEEKRLKNFGGDLQKAEMANNMEQGRKIHQLTSNKLTVPERYQYVHSLTQKGIAAADIASILTISPQEADQLVALANLTNR